jgi:predicted unusual protein kinase regulating ubiquinone biosynthesis (AarF/ABC1/UbiB family)
VHLAARSSGCRNPISDCTIHLDVSLCVQILSSIGEDLLVASADKPFRFPAEFTFVVRSFTVLDGIGKSLSPRFDISEISAPYARELILDGKSAYTQVKDQLAKRVARQNRAVKELFTGPLTIREIAEGLKRCAAGCACPRLHMPAHRA